MHASLFDMIGKTSVLHLTKSWSAFALHGPFVGAPSLPGTMLPSTTNPLLGDPDAQYIAVKIDADVAPYNSVMENLLYELV